MTDQEHQKIPASIIIPTYNRSTSLARTLRSIAQHTYDRPFDVTVIDDGSPDDTRDVLTELQRELPYKLTFHTQQNAGPAIARNLGISSTTGSIVVFLDDDHEVLPGWLDKLCAPLSNLAIGIVNGKNDSVPDGGLAARYVCMRDEGEADKVEKDKTQYLTSGNAAIRRETLETVGGFNPAFRSVFKGVAPGGEDTDLGRRIRELDLEIHYQPEARTYHYREMKMSKLFKERFNFGRNRVHWMTDEGRRPKRSTTAWWCLLALLAFVSTPKSTIGFYRQGYSWSDSIAFACIDKFTRLTYEAGTLYGLFQR